MLIVKSQANYHFDIQIIQLKPLLFLIQCRDNTNKKKIEFVCGFETLVAMKDRIRFAKGSFTIGISKIINFVDCNQKLKNQILEYFELIISDSEEEIKSGNATEF